MCLMMDVTVVGIQDEKLYDSDVLVCEQFPNRDTVAGLSNTYHLSNNKEFGGTQSCITLR